MRYFWGLLLVSVGAAYLSASLGYIDYSQIEKLWFWWPLVLVFIGFDLLLKRFKFGWVGMIALTLLAGLAIYDISFAPKSYISPSRSYTVEREVKKSETSIKKEKEAKNASIEVKTGAIEFNILGVSDNLLEGTLNSNFAELFSKSILNGETQNIELSTQSFTRPMMMWFGTMKNNLLVSLSDKTPINLKVESGASKLNFDLSKYIVSKVDIDAGASTIDLKLGEKIENRARVMIDSGASAINILVPKSVGVRVATESGLTTKNFEGFTLIDGLYENELYKTAAKKIEIDLKAGASTLTIKQY